MELSQRVTTSERAIATHRPASTSETGPGDRGPRRVNARGHGEEPVLDAVAGLRAQLGPDRLVFREPARGVVAGLAQQRAAGLRAELPPEEQAQPQAVTRRHALHGLREQLPQPRASGIGEHEQGGPRAPRILAAHETVALQLGERRVDLAEALVPEVPEHVADGLAEGLPRYRMATATTRPSATWATATR
jgi:hypothetical protein